MNLTLEQATELKSELFEAYKASISGKSYEINMGGTVVKLTRNSPKEIKEQIEYLDIQIRQIQRGNQRTAKKVIPFMR